MKRNLSAPPRKCLITIIDVSQQDTDNEYGIVNQNSHDYTQQQQNYNQQQQKTIQTNIQICEIKNNQAIQIQIQNQNNENFKQKSRFKEGYKVNQNQDNQIFSSQINGKPPKVIIKEQISSQKLQQQNFGNNPKQEEIDYQKHITEQLKIYEKPLLRKITNYQIRFYDPTKVDVEQSQIKKANKIEVPNQPFSQSIRDEILNDQNQKVMELSLFKLKIFSNNQLIDIVTTEFQKSDPSDQQQAIIKYNQIFDNETKQILTHIDRKVNSPIIDAYGTYLQQEDEKVYFTLGAEQRKRYPRLFIFTSDLISSCNITSRNFRENRYQAFSDKMRDKQIVLFLEKLKNFQAIQYQFQLIYQKIAFIVNINNFHWCVIEVKLEYNLLIIYDSLNKSTYNLERFFNEIFSVLLQRQVRFSVISKEDFEQQKDAHSCGYYSCIALKYISQTEGRRKFVSKEQIIDELRLVLL